MAEAGCIVGMDVGGTHLRLGAVMPDAPLEVLAPKAASSRGLGADAAGALLAQLRDYIADLKQPVLAVGIGLPAALDAARGRVLSTPNVAGLNGVEIKAPFEAALGLPVFLEKDACMLACHDLAALCLAPTGLVAGLYFGTGIGCVLLQNGVPLVGRHGVAGELGHIPLPGRTAPCGCGLTGCLEEYAGGKALERIGREHFPATPIGRLFEEQAGAPPLEDYLELMAGTVAGLASLLDPDLILLGGGVPAMAGFPRQWLAEMVRAKTRQPLPAEDLALVFSPAQGAYAGVAGAALYAARRLAAGEQAPPAQG